MDFVTTSLEALLQRITNPQNNKPDVPGIEAFCVLIIKEPDGVVIGSKLLASHIQSTNEKEALQTLTLLDTCMDRCGTTFHAEIGKFRFLNEMIRLVSPKYLGNKTPNLVREKILQLLYRWIEDYPRETKIKEAYQMLKKQGVVKDDLPLISNKNIDDVMPLKKHAIFEDEEKSKTLRKLLRSKNPDDLQAANRLIKTMVKEDEQRLQQNSQRTMELESVHVNVKLLSEMLDSYDPNETSQEDLELMKELHEACKRLKPSILKLLNEIQDNAEILGKVLSASDELSQIFDKFNDIIILGHTIKSHSPSLLDLSSFDSQITTTTTTTTTPTTTTESRDLMPSNTDVLGDIFSCIENSLASDNNLLMSNTNVLQPINVLSSNVKSKDTFNLKPVEKNNKTKALEELDELGESLLKENLLWITSTSTSSVLEKKNELDCSRLNGNNSTSGRTIGNEKSLLEVEPLTDINVNLQDIKPGIHPPKTVIEEKNGITVVLHFAKDSPREDVSVIVITTVNKNKKPLQNYLFQAMVSKKCKCRLQSPSGTGLPAHNPFLPPSAITQIMLIANPNREAVLLKFMLSYNMDGETYTEMGEVENIPHS